LGVWDKIKDKYKGFAFDFFEKGYENDKAVAVKRGRFCGSFNFCVFVGMRLKRGGFQPVESLWVERQAGCTEADAAKGNFTKAYLAGIA